MNKKQILKEYFGYDEFREGQELLIDSVLAGRDVLGIMPTGAGKSLCYQVPALLLPGITLVISPLISLMKDQVQALNQAGVHAAFINSSLSEIQISKALELAKRGRYKIIYVAPERLESYGFQDFAQAVDISMVTVDEAHCISQWGQDFRPSYLNIVRFIKSLAHRPVVSAFTATATTLVREDIECVLGLQDPQVLVTGFDRKNLYFAVEKPRKKEDFLLEYLSEHGSESGIIYCATRKNVEKVQELLEGEKIPAIRYHAGLSLEERRQNQEDFIYDRKPVMVATNAFGMGIDKSNVRYVIHFNMPQSMENYYQEAGRAGRDGEPGECILLYSAQDLMVNRFLIDSKTQNPEYDQQEQGDLREQDERRLQAMVNYCMTTDCLRTYILNYFGESGMEPCGNCSNCQQEFQSLDVTQAAISVAECVWECRQRYGAHVIAGIVCGHNTAKLREYGVTELNSYGAQKELTEARMRQIIQTMILEGVLTATQDKYALLRQTDRTTLLLQGEIQISLKIPKSEPKEPAARTKKSKAKGSKFDILNTKGLEFFDMLRQLRTEIAREEKVPPYLVFSDKTLVDMCRKVPLTPGEMLEVTGVGEHKFQKYGDCFLEAIKGYTGGKKEKYYYG